MAGDVTSDGTSVLVVGAGPTGLVLASELVRRGVACELIDERPGPQAWDRATVIHPGSLEVFEALGIADRFLAAGTPQRGARIYSDGEVLGEYEITDSGSTYPFNLGMSEEVTESIVADHLRALGGDVTRSARLVGLTPSADGLVAEIDRAGSRSSTASDGSSAATACTASFATRAASCSRATRSPSRGRCSTPPCAAGPIGSTSRSSTSSRFP